MKKILLFVLFCLLVFIGLTYWSVSVGPSEILISPVVEPENLSAKDLRNLKQVRVFATNEYQANSLKKFMQGTNYRKAWEAPVTAEVLNLDSYDLLKEGGGNQTKSLKIRDQKKIFYSLRSVNKDPSPLIPEAAEFLNLENIVRDGISAQHPYGALLAASLADAAGILHTHPRLVYVPMQDKLGEFSHSYGNKLYLLEYETEGDFNWTSHPRVSKIVETDDLQNLKKELGKNLEIDTRQLVKTRLFDLLIGDWDRHSKQWGWALEQEGDEFLAVPIPGDRDNAFFRIDGVIPTILTNKMVEPMVRPFEKDIDHIAGYVYPFDLYFLKDVPKEIFLKEAKELQKKLTDEQIQQALQKWPKELRELNGNEIFQKLRSRRNKLSEYAAAFWKEIDEAEYLEEPLKGSEDLELPPLLEKCFNCY